MFIKQKSHALLSKLRNGSITPRQFVHGLNRLITVRKPEPTTVTKLDAGLYLVQTNDHELVAKLLGADVEVSAQSRDSNGIVDKLRVIVTDEELHGIGVSIDE